MADRRRTLTASSRPSRGRPSRGRAVSDTLAFVLLFAVLLTSLTAAATLGVDSLTTVRDGAVRENAGLTVDSLAETVEELRRDGVGVRRGELRLGGGGLAAASEPVRVTVDVGNDGSAELDRRVEPIVYRFEGTRVHYEAGAVVRTRDDDGLVSRPPPVRFDDDGIVLPVVSTTATAETVRVSGQRASVEFVHESATVVASGTTDAVALRIETGPARAAAWHDRLEERIGTGSDPCSVGTNTNPDTPAATVDCTYSPGPGTPVVVRLVTVRYRIS